MSEETEERARRILVLGSTGHASSITAYEWDSLPECLNVSDYDLVILNFAPFTADPTLMLRVEHARLPRHEAFGRLIFSANTEVVAIGDPSALICPGVGAWWWSPVICPWETERGETITDIRKDFAFHFRAMKGWQSHFKGTHSSQGVSYEYRTSSAPEVGAIAFEVEPLAVNRAGRAIGLDIATRVQGGPAHGRINHIYWLPVNPDVEPAQPVDALLRERYGVGRKTAPPDWASGYQLPSQEPLEAELADRQRELEEAQHALEGATEAAKRERLFQGLLYERGEDGLEPIVRTALTQLGGVEEEVQERGREDGRFTAPDGQRFIVEIKARGGQLRVGDTRQLLDWVGQAEDEEGWSGDALLIANTHAAQPPAERGEAFPPNCVSFAVRAGQTLMTTTQLFAALSDLQTGDLTPDQFWAAAREGKGPCSLRDLSRS